MTGRRVVSSGGGKKTGGTSNKHGARRRSGRSSESLERMSSSKSGRRVESDKRAGSDRSKAVRLAASSSAASLTGAPSRSRSAPGAFVDPSALQNEDLVAKTLQETTGTLGVAARPKVIDFNERVKERRKASVRHLAVKLCAMAAAVAVVAGLVWFLFFSPVFLLERSQISISGGNAWVSKSEIMSIAEKQKGKSLFLVSSTDVEKQLKEIPGVFEAKADKRYPQGLSVAVKAQEPAAMLKTPEGRMTAVDGKGRVLNSVGNVDVKGIPVIEVSQVSAGLNKRAVQQALKILSQLPKSMRRGITKVSAQTQDSVTTELNGGERVIVWGDSSQLDLKKAVVDKIINDPTKIGDKHQVDVSAPLRPIIK
ncbi:cell division protein FtsQ [Bifidobacterium bohemicum]|uniref:Cell division protein n=1 Tax=Bifidobacterium bohemicum DSM 22767 TaxID=1437606 RepID=A0A086ZGE9_9BIFI|nr:FtsQ-type POTRA domain-containing protein [Bifidobacterium bohemicum]KFI45599.1 cell division protein [Bifidobacterium bohemicum DSM 22767]SCC01003.1 cell division protein FtsQ [Bifidobacterium bohemicum]